jgi:anthranilate synthase component 1
VAPTVRSFSADFDPLGLVARAPERYPGILESGAVAAAGAADRCRYDLLPIASGEALTAASPGGAGDGFFASLDRWWRELATARADAPAPFGGGWLVFLGYELAQEVEPRLDLPASPDPFVGIAIRTPAAWIRDRVTGRAWLVAEAGHEALLDRFAEDVAAMPPFAPRWPPAPPPPWTVEEEAPGRFLRSVRGALAHIAAGDVYQANLSRRWWGRAPGGVDPTALFARLRKTNPSPFAALLRYRDFAVVSSSPERLLAIRDGVASTRPIAGTRPRGATAADDAALVRALLSNEKERAEHVMLIDLERNDLGRICRGGSVAVDEYMSIESYAHVHHIVSNVTGRLREGVSPIDALRAVFPGGTITGCPKVRCMQIVAALEAEGRGAYTGSIGYLNRDGSADFNILIRTFTTGPDGFALRAGAGIVADSDPDLELAETRAKAKGLLRALSEPA